LGAVVYAFNAFGYKRLVFWGALAAVLTGQLTLTKSNILGNMLKAVSEVYYSARAPAESASDPDSTQAQARGDSEEVLSQVVPQEEAKAAVAALDGFSLALTRWLLRCPELLLRWRLRDVAALVGCLAVSAAGRPETQQLLMVSPGGELAKGGAGVVGGLGRGAMHKGGAGQEGCWDTLGLLCQPTKRHQWHPTMVTNTHQLLPQHTACVLPVPPPPPTHTHTHFHTHSHPHLRTHTLSPHTRTCTPTQPPHPQPTHTQPTHPTHTRFGHPRCWRSSCCWTPPVDAWRPPAPAMPPRSPGRTCTVACPTCSCWAPWPARSQRQRPTYERPTSANCCGRTPRSTSLTGQC
jgi:hypothetical protein